jgi:hypothetical protein
LRRPWPFNANPTVDCQIPAANPLSGFLLSGDREADDESMEIRIGASRRTILPPSWQQYSIGQIRSVVLN